MPDLFKYTHFGPYLRDWFEAAKAEGRPLSVQTVSTALGLKSKSLLHRLMNDPKATMSPQVAEALSKFIGHGKLEAEYFQYLVLFCRVRTSEEKGKLYAHMHRLLERLRPQYLADWQLDYFQEWHMPALRELVDCKPAPRTADEVAKRMYPPISVAQARKGIELLLKLGLIAERRGGHGWQSTQRVLDAPPDLTNVVVHGYQKKMLECAMNAHENLDAAKREMVTTTFSIPGKDFEAIRTVVRNFQNDLTRAILSLDGQCDDVYQVNVQFFPLSLPEST